MINLTTFPVVSTATVVLCSYFDPIQLFNSGGGGTVPNPLYRTRIVAEPMFPCT